MEEKNKITNKIALNKNIIIAITFCLFFLAVGLIVGYYSFYAINTTIRHVFAVRQGGYKFINPLLECDIEIGEVGNTGLLKLKKKLTDFIDKKIGDNSIISAAVYLRDLNNGPWVGVNEKTNFAPASLLKVPIMIAYFKEAESDPGLFKKELTFKEKSDNVAPDFVPTKTLTLGQSYTVEDLINRMIIYSDNDAKNLLLMNINQKTLDQCYADLGISIPNIRTPNDYMSVKEYASFFRILYNASYLDRQFSEKALSILVQSNFRDGLTAGVNGDIMVAHKFGERAESVGGKEIDELHDCGIVYYPNHPYLLCIMTKGVDFTKMSETIKQISALTFAEIQSEKN